MNEKIGKFNEDQSIFSTRNALYLNRYKDETFETVTKSFGNATLILFRKVP